MSLSEKTKGETIKILEKLELAKIKTKQIVEIIKNLKITEQKIILVLDKYDDKVIKSARNLAQLKFIAANSLNAIDIVRADVVLTTISGIKKIEKTYGSDKQN
jgi:large subunit ribosomal protein L4